MMLGKIYLFSQYAIKDLIHARIRKAFFEDKFQLYFGLIQRLKQNEAVFVLNREILVDYNDKDASRIFYPASILFLIK